MDLVFWLEEVGIVCWNLRAETVLSSDNPNITLLPQTSLTVAAQRRNFTELSQNPCSSRGLCYLIGFIRAIRILGLGIRSRFS